MFLLYLRAHYFYPSVENITVLVLTYSSNASFKLFLIWKEVNATDTSNTYNFVLDGMTSMTKLDEEETIFLAPIVII